MTDTHQDFLNYLTNWEHQLGMTRPGQADKSALVCVDLINGFCSEGALSSPRVQGIVPSIVTLFKSGREYGIRNMILIQDSHEPDAMEFHSFAPHCIRGTSEAEPVPELKALPFFNEMQIFPKNSIHAGLQTGFSGWIAAHPEVDTFLVCGDCTDLCTYQLAMYLRLDANARQLQRRVVAPADCIQTYDISLEDAAKFGVLPHDGDLMHLLFLYHMALNGIEIVRNMDWH